MVTNLSRDWIEKIPYSTDRQTDTHTHTHTQSQTPLITLPTPVLPTVLVTATKQTRSHPEMVGDMSRVTLNFDLSKIPFVLF